MEPFILGYLLVIFLFKLLAVGGAYISGFQLWTVRACMMQVFGAVPVQQGRFLVTLKGLLFPKNPRLWELVPKWKNTPRRTDTQPSYLLLNLIYPITNAETEVHWGAQRSPDRGPQRQRSTPPSSPSPPLTQLYYMKLYRHAFIWKWEKNKTECEALRILEKMRQQRTQCPISNYLPLSVTR